MNVLAAKSPSVIIIVLFGSSLSCCVAQTQTENALEDHNAVLRRSREDGINATNLSSNKTVSYVLDIPYHESENVKEVKRIKDSSTKMSTSENMVLSKECTRSLLKLVPGITISEDTSAKEVSPTVKDLRYGSPPFIGTHRQCLDTQNGASQVFKSQYCSAEVTSLVPSKLEFEIKAAFDQYFQARKIQKSVNFRFGICLPDACTKNDLATIIKQVSEEIQANVTVSWCEKDTFEVDNLQIIAGSVLAVLVLLVVIATTVDILPRFLAWLFETTNPFSRYEDFVPLQVLRCFSVYVNVPKIMSTEVREGDLPELRGVVVFTVAWLILGNAFTVVYDLPEDHLNKSQSGNWAFQIILNSSLAAETFLFISGFLLEYWQYKRMDQQHGKFHVLHFYLRRYWRLTPAYVLVSMTIMLSPLTGFGSYWHEKVRPLIVNCREYWWTNLIYIGNFIRTENSCLPHAWYIACDMQFFLISPIIILTLYKRPLVGKFLILGGILISTVILAVMTWILGLPPTQFNTETASNFTNTIVTKPYTHISAYLVGISIAYLVIKKEKLRIRPIIQLFGWIAAFCLMFSVVYGTTRWYHHHMPPTAVSVLYAATSRLAWTLGVAWVVLLCVTGQAGLIGRFLSWPGFVPLSRLSYVAFLIHPTIIHLFLTFLGNSIIFTRHVTAYLYLSHLLAT